MSFVVTEVRPYAPVDFTGASSPQANMFTVFLKCAYANSTNAPIYRLRRLSEVVLNCVVERNGASFVVRQGDPVSSLVKYHPLPSLTKEQAETLTKDYLLTSVAPSIEIPDDMEQSSYNGPQTVKKALDAFVRGSSEYGVTIANASVINGLTVSGAKYSMRVPEVWKKYERSQNGKRFNLYENLSLRVLSVSPASVKFFGETEETVAKCAVVDYVADWEENSVYKWWQSACMVFQKTMNDNNWNYTRIQGGNVEVMDGTSVTNQIEFHWAVEENAWRQGRQ